MDARDAAAEGFVVGDEIIGADVCSGDEVEGATGLEIKVFVFTFSERSSNKPMLLSNFASI